MYYIMKQKKRLNKRWKVWPAMNPNEVSGLWLGIVNEARNCFVKTNQENYAISTNPNSVSLQNIQ